MELAIPLVALGGLYMVSKQVSNPQKNEAFTSMNRDGLPNIDVPNRNFPDEFPVISAESDKTSRLSTINKYDSTGSYTDKYFNPNMIASTMPMPKDSKKMDNLNDGGKQYYSLTGNNVSSTYFQHNNMVPFFGSNVRTMLVDENSQESMLDNLVGAGSQITIKKENAPLFSPSKNLQWAHGAPNTSEFMQSRVLVGNKMSNVTPFETQRIAPGLGKDGESNGFNSGMMMREAWMPKNVDELRADNKPKSTNMLLGFEGPAMSRVQNMGSIGTVEKNRPDRHFEMTPERYMTTTGAEKGYTIQALPIDRYVTRPETTTSYAGGAGSANNSVYVDGEYMPSTRINHGELPLGCASATGRHGSVEGEYEMRSKVAYPNNRTTSNVDDYFGAIGGAFGAAVAPLLDVIRPTRKENTIGNARPYENARIPVQQGYLFNPTDRPGATIRETTEKSKMHWNVNRGQNGGAYEVTKPQLLATERQSTGDYFYSGAPGGGDGARNQRTYMAEYNQRNNDRKSSTIQGYMVQGNMSLGSNHVNMRNNNMDEIMKNNRAVVPTMPSSTPDFMHMGQLQGHSSLYSTIQTDRNNPEILSMLKSNPYTLSITD